MSDGVSGVDWFKCAGIKMLDGFQGVRKIFLKKYK